MFRRISSSFFSFVHSLFSSCHLSFSIFTLPICGMFSFSFTCAWFLFLLGLHFIVLRIFANLIFFDRYFWLAWKIGRHYTKVETKKKDNRIQYNVEIYTQHSPLLIRKPIENGTNSYQHPHIKFIFQTQMICISDFVFHCLCHIMQTTKTKRNRIKMVQRIEKRPPENVII